jgi:hypothetical protein
LGNLAIAHTSFAVSVSIVTARLAAGIPTWQPSFAHEAIDETFFFIASGPVRTA